MLTPERMSIVTLLDYNGYLRDNQHLWSTGSRPVAQTGVIPSPCLADDHDCRPHPGLMQTRRGAWTHSVHWHLAGRGLLHAEPVGVEHVLGKWPPWFTALGPNISAVALALGAIGYMEYHHTITRIVQQRWPWSKESRIDGSIWMIGDVQGCCSPLDRLLAHPTWSEIPARASGSRATWSTGPPVAGDPAPIVDLGDRATSVLGSHDLHLLARRPVELIGIPLGVLMARVNWLRSIMLPVLDVIRSHAQLRVPDFGRDAVWPGQDSRHHRHCTHAAADPPGLTWAASAWLTAKCWKRRGALAPTRASSSSACK